MNLFDDFANDESGKVLNPNSTQCKT